MTQPTLPTGARVVGPAHAGVCGTWWRALTPDGSEQLVLRIAAPAPALADRVTTATRAVATLRHGGLLGSAEPIRHNGALWLVATGASGSTLSELAETDGPGLDLPAVATIAAETARTLVALHAAGLGHGAVHGRTVVVTALGAVTLTETALLPALHGVPADPATDRRAWAELVRWLVARWCGAQSGSDLLLRCAARGEQDLAQAVRELRDIPLPVGSDGRTGLLTAVAAHRHRTAQEDPTVAAWPALPPRTPGTAARRPRRSRRPSRPPGSVPPVRSVLPAGPSPPRRSRSACRPRHCRTTPPPPRCRRHRRWTPSCRHGYRHSRPGRRHRRAGRTGRPPRTRRPPTPPSRAPRPRGTRRPAGTSPSAVPPRPPAPRCASGRAYPTGHRWRPAGSVRRRRRPGRAAPAGS
ncbi:hypothetical protein [Micromonospora echinospora]|uniref:hypothetical protein n=1 Tax=Micromonospora echinospora TaxID=1877 RepID=UPI003A855E7E